jgi:RNA polymerase sigma factor (sigma-70 family)
VELLEQVRQGDEAAFTELFARHRAVARRVALTYRCPGDPDDLVNEAFEKVLAAVRRGHGPTDAFRAYLLVTMRRLAADQAGRPRDERLDDVPEAVTAAAADGPLDSEERSIVTRAFESLPDRWQAVLWYTAVEGRHPRELAPLLGVSANAVSALAYRAREQLRQAYLQAHLQTWARPQCEPHRSLLGAYVRDGQSRRERAATQRHLDGCATCQSLVIELNEVNSLLVRSILPLFPAAALANAVPAAAGAAGAAAAGGAAPAGGASLLATAVGEGGAQAARRGLAGATGLKQVGATLGSVAAATGLLVGLAGMGAFVAGDEDGDPGVSLRTDAPGTTLAPATTAGAPAAPVTTAAAPPPGADAAADPCYLLDVSAELDSGSLTDEGTDGDDLLSLDIGTPHADQLTAESGTPAGQAADAGPACEAGADDQGALQIGLDTDLGGDGDLAGVDLSLLDLEVMVELGTGATALDVGLPGGCDIVDAGRTVICSLDSLTPSSVGVALDTAGTDTGATVTVSQGDRTVDVKTVEVLDAVGGLGSSPTAGAVDPLAPLLRGG